MLTTADEANIGLLDGELKKVSAKAKALSPSPFFDAGIFDELMTALYRDSLGLTEDQVGLLHELNSSVFEELPEDLDALSPFHKFLLRREVLSRVWEGFQESLSDAQLEDWEYARKYSEAMLRYGGRFHTSVDVSERDLLRGWLGTGVDDASSKEVMESLAPIEKDYLNSAKGVLQEYAQTNEELEALPWERRAGLEERLLNLQEQFERRATPILSENQRQKLQEGEPTIIQFRYGDLYFSQAPGSLF